MSHSTELAELLGLAGVEVDVVEREADGSWTVHVTTAPGQAACCPGCGQPARRVKERAAHSVKHLAVVPARVTWHKCRLRCENTACGTGGFAETGPVAAPGAAVSTHARTVMGHLVGDWLVPVSRVAASAGVSWHTAHDSFFFVFFVPFLLAGQAGHLRWQECLVGGEGRRGRSRCCQRRVSQHREAAATGGSQLPGGEGATGLERDHQTSVRELGEGQLQAACSCGWRSIVFGADKQLGTMDALQHAQDAADLHQWDAALP